MDESNIEGPFGPATRILSLPVTDILAAYRLKCGADVSRCFEGLSEVYLYECQVTGYRFWRPETIAADEGTYHLLSAAWPGYYRGDRWEYGFVRNALRKTDNVLEVGCGQGNFLRSLEGRVRAASGIELNAQAIKNKVTKFDILRMTIEEFKSRSPASLDAVCSFQVLEHVSAPRQFIEACAACLRPGGLLFLSTPNMECAMLRKREDAFDLPPHHIGHFSAQVYESIARTLGLEVAGLRVEVRHTWAADTLNPTTEHHILYRATKRLTSVMLNAVYNLLGEPGNYILATLRKPE
jgi:2-polyprenyl-3-methyl-5-hydroxy-6-metoxy-1,4-benzoquinol methylase